MNKYLRRGLLEIILAVILILVSYYLMKLQNNWYKPIMILGVISFGVGFLRIIYRLIRKIDRNALIEMRKEKKDKYIIEMDLPGYEKENINLSLKDGYLEVTAEVNKEDDNEEKDKFVHKERYYGHCSRSFYVGEQIKEEEVNAEFKNGILKICIPKKEERKELPEAKHIEIK